MLVQTILLNLVVTRLAEAAEFCNWEIFQPRCDNNEIIVIEKAYFGRKNIGRCLTAEGVSYENNLNDSKFVGCYSDVKRDIDQQCSGKRQCEVDISKIEDETNLCYKWLKFHLDVDYSCLQVIQESIHCTVALRSDKQFISSYQFTESGCGSKNHPWIIESLAGQRVKITPIHVANSEDPIQTGIHFMTSEKTPSCSILGTVSEKNKGNETMLCLTRSSLNSINSAKASFLSSSNNLVVKLIHHRNKMTQNFILVVEAAGCSDLIPPSDAWLKRNENEATIGCYSTRLRWKLKCVGQRWIGVIGNCSQGMSFKDTSIATSAQESEMDPFQNLVPIVAIATAGLVVCFLIICIGVVFINRYYAKSKSSFMKPDMNHSIPRNEYNNVTLYHKDLQYTIGKENNQGTPLDDVNIEDSAQYFELEQSLINGNTLSKV